MSIAEKLLTIANNTPAVAEVVKSSTDTVSGKVVRVDALKAEQPLLVKTVPGAEVKVYGKNLVDYTQAAGRNTSQKVEIVEDGVVWKAGGDYYFQIPLTIPAGVTVRGSWVSETNAAGEYMQFMRLVYEDGTLAGLINGTEQYTVTTTQSVKALYLYKASAGTKLTQDLLVKNIQVEVGTTITDYEPFKAPQTVTADADGKVTGLTVAPTITLVCDEVMECSHSSSDTLEKYQAIMKKMTELRDSISKEE